MTASHRFSNELRYLDGRDDRHRRPTPSYILEPVRRLLGGIALDVCSESDNPTRAAKFYSPPQDGLTLPWNAATVWCNPPYAKAKEPWVERCIAEAGRGARIALLIPAQTETRIFQAALFACTSCLLLKGRIKFGVLRPNRREESASHGSALFGFGVALLPLANLGVIVRPLNPKLALEARI